MKKTRSKKSRDTVPLKYLYGQFMYTAKADLVTSNQLKNMRACVRSSYQLIQQTKRATSALAFLCQKPAIILYSAIVEWIKSINTPQVAATIGATYSNFKAASNYL